MQREKELAELGSKLRAACASSPMAKPAPEVWRTGLSASYVAALEAFAFVRAAGEQLVSRLQAACVGAHCKEHAFPRALTHSRGCRSPIWMLGWHASWAAS